MPQHLNVTDIFTPTDYLQRTTDTTMKRFRQKYYDFFSLIYDRFVALHSTDRALRLRYFLADTTGLKKGDKVLDICTGTGSALLPLKEKVQAQGLVIGVDFSIGMLKAGRSKTTSHERIFLVLADVGYLPFKKQAFNAVTCSHAFYELKGETQDNCLQEVRRVLKPGMPFLMMEHDVPKNFFVRMLFYLRLLSMGPQKAFEILRHERELLMKYFKSVKKMPTPTGRSKIMICRERGT
jgi:ubiquinone/menaquinone biosynthesis C-methylase UbiE